MSMEAWEFVRMLECAMAVANVRLFGERGNAARRIMGKIMAELVSDRLPDDPREALLRILEPLAEVKLDGDRVRVEGCRVCYSNLLLDVATDREMKVIRKVVPCNVVNLFNSLAELKGWNVRLRPERTPLSDDTEPGSCVQRLERASEEGSGSR
ncbi:MAG: hypothetical protein ABGY09_03715 [Euryarchaeota archaeon]